jgi:transcription antitermination factor NusA-like protein
LTIPSELLTPWLPRFEDAAPERFRYGARSPAAVYVGDLLCTEVPSLATGELTIVAMARRPGVLSKVAIRSPFGTSVGADHLARVRHQLDGERIDVVTWQPSAPAYITAALGLAEMPPIVLLPAIRHARVLVGEIDVRGIAGWRGLNSLLASALTAWRIRLEPVALTHAWARLEGAMRAKRPVIGTVIGRTERGVRVDVLGLYAVLAESAPLSPPGSELALRVTRMDPDEGRIFVSDRLAVTGQLMLPLT